MTVQLAHLRPQSDLRQGVFKRRRWHDSWLQLPPTIVIGTTVVVVVVTACGSSSRRRVVSWLVGETQRRQRRTRRLSSQATPVMLASDWCSKDSHNFLVVGGAEP